MYSVTVRKTDSITSNSAASPNHAFTTFVNSLIFILFYFFTYKSMFPRA